MIIDTMVVVPIDIIVSYFENSLMTRNNVMAIVSNTSNYSKMLIIPNEYYDEYDDSKIIVINAMTIISNEPNDNDRNKNNDDNKQCQ